MGFCDECIKNGVISETEVPVSGTSVKVPGRSKLRAAGLSSSTKFQYDRRVDIGPDVVHLVSKAGVNPETGIGPPLLPNLARIRDLLIDCGYDATSSSLRITSSFRPWDKNSKDSHPRSAHCHAGAVDMAVPRRGNKKTDFDFTFSQNKKF